MTNFAPLRAAAAGLALLGAGLLATGAQAAFFHVGDGSIDGRLCLGPDCISAEIFGVDTFRLKESNLRLHFDDTSSAVGNFPDNDWRIIVNDSANFGADYFAIEDDTANTVPFRIDAGAPTDSLRVGSSGNVGFGTATPARDLHIQDGSFPTVRLDQDGSQGLTPQTWDVVGSGASFFIRDVTSGNTVPFTIRTGAPDSAIDIAASGNVGLGTATPDGELDIESDAPEFRLTETGAGSGLPVRHRLQNGTYRMSFVGSGATEFLMTPGGNVTLQGTLTTGGPVCGGGCDRVFEADYDLPSIEEHADQM